MRIISRKKTKMFFQAYITQNFYGSADKICTEQFMSVIVVISRRPCARVMKAFSGGTPHDEKNREV